MEVNGGGGGCYAVMLNERPTNSVCHTTIVSCLTKASAINSKHRSCDQSGCWERRHGCHFVSLRCQKNTLQSITPPVQLLCTASAHETHLLPVELVRTKAGTINSKQPLTQ